MSSSDISDAAAGAQLSTIMSQVLKAFCTHTAWSRGSLMRINEKQDLSEMVAEYSPYSMRGPEAGRTWQLSMSPMLECLRTGEPLVIQDAKQADHLPAYREDAVRLGYCTLALLPLAALDAEGHQLVLFVSSFKQVQIDERELGFLKALIDLASVAIDQAVRAAHEIRWSTTLGESVERRTKMLARILNGDGPSTVIRLALAGLSGPGLVVDALSGQVHVSPALESGGAHQGWEALLRDTDTKSLADQVLMMAIDNEPPSRRLHLQDMLPSGARIEPLLVDSNITGVLIADPGDGPLDSLRLAEAKAALSMQLMRGYIESRIGSESLAEVVNRLIKGDWRNEQEMVAQARRAGLRVEQPHQLLATVLLSQEDGPSAETSTDWYLSRRLKRNMSSVDNDAVVQVDGTRLLVLLRVSRNQSAKLKRCVQILRSNLGPRLDDNSAFSVSETCTSCADYIEAARATQHALRLAGVLGRSGLVSEADFGSYALLLGATTQPEVAKFVENVLGPLQRYDEKHGKHLTDTLWRFLAGGRRYQQCADELGIHVSTVRYRIDRIGKLLDTDLENRDAQFTLQLALRLDELRKPTQ